MHTSAVTTPTQEEEKIAKKAKKKAAKKRKVKSDDERAVYNANYKKAGELYGAGGITLRAAAAEAAACCSGTPLRKRFFFQPFFLHNRIKKQKEKENETLCLAEGAVGERISSPIHDARRYSGWQLPYLRRAHPPNPVDPLTLSSRDDALTVLTDFTA